MEEIQQGSRASVSMPDNARSGNDVCRYRRFHFSLICKTRAAYVARIPELTAVSTPGRAHPRLIIIDCFHKSGEKEALLRKNLFQR